MGTLSKGILGMRVIGASDKYISGKIVDTKDVVLNKVRVQWDPEYTDENGKRLPICVMNLNDLLPYKTKFGHWWYKNIGRRFVRV